MEVNPDRKVDAIVVIFGAGIRPDGKPSSTLLHRVEAGVRCSRHLGIVVFIPTGGKGRYGDAEAFVMRRLLVQAGICEGAIIPEPTAADTLSSVRAVRRLLGHLPKVPVYACSSGYHLPRCVLLLRLAGIRAHPCPPPPVPAASNIGRRWYWRLREIPALPYDAILMAWHRLTGSA